MNTEFRDVIRLLEGYRDLPHGIDKKKIEKVIFILSEGIGVLISRKKRYSGETKIKWFDEL